MVAELFVTLHEPPETVSVSVIATPGQTEPEPVIVPTAGSAFTVII
jgi:hypothetical protein